MASFKEGAIVLLVSTAIGLGVGTLGYNSVDIPTLEQAQPAVSVAGPSIVVDDPQEVLAAGDRQRLIDAASAIPTPDYVTDVHFMVFASNHDNVLDTVEEYTRDNYPQLIDDNHGDNGSFKEGVVVIGIGLDPRNAFAYGGFDTGEKLGLTDESHLANILDAMKPDVKAGDIPAGLEKSARLTLDADAVAQYTVDAKKGERVGNTLGGGFGTGGVAMALGFLGLALRDHRRKELATGREDYELVTGEYLRLAQRLDEVDIRAHSLSSAFADAELRKQWAEVRDRFLDLNDTVHGAGGIGEIDITDDKAVRKNRKRLAEAAETVEHTSNAEDNIDRLFAIEQGDTGARRADLEVIRSDIADARAKVEEGKHPERHADLIRDLEMLEQRVDALKQDPASPTFIDDLVRVLGDYRLALEDVRSSQFDDVKEREKLTTPAVYDATFWYPNYMTYAHLNTWHDANVAAAQAASATSSSGFSAAGGSSGF